jgi:epoxyqueuosine reductase
MTHQRGLARAQIASQFNVGQAQFGQRRQRAGKALGGGFIVPQQAFYNGQVINTMQQLNGSQWVSKIQDWGRALGFSQIGVAGVDLTAAEPGLSAWLAAGCHGDMFYMAAHGLKRARPTELVPGTLRVITARMDYLPADTPEGWQALELDRLARPAEAIVSVYARGRDYHKVMRSRLQKLSDQIAAALGPLGYRVFTDSAPVLEAELASLSGLGWRGKHTLLLSREAGSTFFLGEIFVDMALPVTAPVASHCGSCSACMDICPTRAIIAPYRLDARRCISYLTIEHAGPIPQELRSLMGNRIYGCDDCQLICPWNKFAQRSALPDFDARAGLAGSQLTELFGWTEETFLRFTEGSPIRRIGHERWLRNIAVALGNALCVADAESARQLVTALASRAEHPSALVREHVAWALAQKN